MTDKKLRARAEYEAEQRVRNVSQLFERRSFEPAPTPVETLHPSDPLRKAVLWLLKNLGHVGRCSLAFAPGFAPPWWDESAVVLVCSCGLSDLVKALEDGK